MIFNITYSNPRVKNQIKEIVGEPFSMMERFKMGGVGSAKMIINMASLDIAEKLDKSPGFKFCNIELRKCGIVIGFQSTLKVYVWVIPFHELVIYHKSSLISIYSNKSHMKMKPFFNSEIDIKFVVKLLELKSRYLNERSPF